MLPPDYQVVPSFVIQLLDQKKRLEAREKQIEPNLEMLLTHHDYQMPPLVGVYPCKRRFALARSPCWG